MPNAMEMTLRSVISRWLPPATCGVMRHFGSHHSGESARQRLRFGHIERGAMDSSFRERVGKRLTFNGVAAARVDDDGVRFERCDTFRIEQVVRCRSGWYAHGDHIGVLQDVVEESKPTI